MRRAGVIRGLALLGIALVCGVAVASLVDFGIRPSSFGVRVLVSCVAIAPALWVGWKLLLPAFRDPISEIEVARLVEEREPRWRGRLAAAAAFQTLDHTAGSRELQDRIVADVSRDVAAEPPPQIIEAARIRRAVFVALLVGGLGLSFAFARPAIARSGLLRLTLPFAEVEWPKAVQLVLIDESGEELGRRVQIGRGQTLRFQVRNVNGDVPDDLALDVLSPDGERRFEAVPTIEDRPQSETQTLVGVGSLFADRGPLRFRAVGGDDRNMPYVVVDVVPQPVLDAMTITVTPPAYLRADAKVFDSGVATGIVGSTVAIEATASKPLAAAQLVVADAKREAAKLSDDGRKLTASFVLQQAGLVTFRFRVRDRSGLVNDDAGRQELRVVGDAVPIVTVVTPSDDVTATADAELPVVLEAKDDQGLTAVRIQFAREGLHYRTERATAEGEADTTTVPLFSGPDRPLQGTYPLLWSLSALELRPGDRLEFCGEATDAFDLGPPHVGRSSPRSVRIISAAEKREELLDRQTDLLDALVRLHADEERILETVRSLRSEAESADELSTVEKDLLSRSELEQRRIASGLTGPDDGLLQHSAQALSELGSNQLDDPALAGRLQRMVAELQVLAEGSLPAAEKNLTAARKAEERAATRMALAATEDELGVILRSVKTLLDDLDAWRSRRDLAGEAGELLAQQRELREETAKVAAQTLGTAAGQLTDQQAQTLDRLRLRQNGLAERLARFDETVRQLAESSGADNAGDSSLSEATELLREFAMPASARAAVESIRSNNLGEAGRLQRQLVGQLQALAEALTRSDGRTADREMLNEAATDLAQLADRQDQLVEELRDAQKSDTALDDETRAKVADRQAGLREETATLATRLRSAAASAAAESTTEAAQSMAEGLGDLRREDDNAALQDLEQARDQLRDAASDAMQHVERLGQQAAGERLDASTQKIEELSERQGRLNVRIRDFEDAKNQSGSLSRSQLLDLRKLAEEQAAVATAAERLAPAFNEAVVVSFAFETAITEMRKVESSLSDKQTGSAVQQSADAAKTKLDAIAAVLASASSERSHQPPEPMASDASADAAPPLVPRFAQLRLLKTLQEDLHQRTRSLDESRGSSALTDEQAELLKRLSVEQKAVLTMFQNIIENADASTSKANE